MHVNVFFFIFLIKNKLPLIQLCHIEDACRFYNWRVQVQILPEPPTFVETIQCQVRQASTVAARKVEISLERNLSLF